MAVYDGAAWKDRILNAYPPASDGERYYSIISVDGSTIYEAVKLKLLNTVLPGNEGVPVNAGNLNKMLAAMGTATLSGNDFIMTMDGFSLFDGAKVRVKFASAKSSPITLNINGSGAKTVNLGAVAANSWHELIYNATAGTFNTVFAVDEVTPGTIAYFGAASAPTGYLICNGAAVASATYPRLYAAIGTTFGGNATNFNIPDLRNQFIRGISSGLSPTTNLGTKYGATSIPYPSRDYATPNYYRGIPESNAVENADASSSAAASQQISTASWTASASLYYRIATVRPANMGLLPCIKY